MNNKISIIIPVFNGKKFIRTAIESCLSQTYKNIEIIVINDGSTDGLTEVDVSYPEDNIVYFEQENRGLGLSRNLGIQKSAGDLVFFLDADDDIPRNALEKLACAIGDSDFVAGKAKRVFLDRTGKSYKKQAWKEREFRGKPDKYRLVVDTISTNKLYRRDFLLENKLEFKTGRFEDKLFVAKLFDESKNFSVLNEVVYNWYVRDGHNSLSSVYTIDTLRERMDVVMESIESVHDEKLKAALIDNAITHDLKLYVNASSFYSESDMESLYEIYCGFIKKYKTYLRANRYGINDPILENIGNKQEAKRLFLMISRGKTNSNASKWRLLRDFLSRVLARIHRFI
jgi:glycosyltransferase involved in cell wall biosynthesis